MNVQGGVNKVGGLAGKVKGKGSSGSKNGVWAKETSPENQQ